MKTSFIAAVAVVSISFSACNGNNKLSEEKGANMDTAAKQTPAAGTDMKGNRTLISEMITAYIQIKNGLVTDDGNDAALGGKAFTIALAKVDKSSMSAVQKKTFEDIADDAKEMAEHISTNADKIEHQRESILIC